MTQARHPKALEIARLWDERETIYDRLRVQLTEESMDRIVEAYEAAGDLILHLHSGEPRLARGYLKRMLSCPCWIPFARRLEKKLRKLEKRAS